MRMKLRNKYDLEGFDELSLRNQIRVMFWTKVIWYYTCFLYIALNLDFLVKGFKWVSFDEFWTLPFTFWVNIVLKTQD